MRAHNFRDLTRQTFGRLRVKELSPVRNKYRYTVWICECSCGNSKLVPVSSSNLVNGVTKSCGCLKRDSLRLRLRIRPFESVYNYLVRHASLRDIKVGLTYEEFLKYTDEKQCHYCGSFIPWNPYRMGRGSAPYFLDRKDSEVGYMPSNLVVCCGKCNRGKSDQFTYDEWVCMTAALRKFRTDTLSATIGAA